MTMFTQYTIETAPAASRRPMTAVTAKQGYLPAAIGLLAESPEALDGFLRLSATFDACTLDALAREGGVMTVSARNGGHLCVAMPPARLAALGADPALAAALRSGAALGEERLDAVRAFTVQVLDTAGDVRRAALTQFLGHGLPPPQPA